MFDSEDASVAPAHSRGVAACRLPTVLVLFQLTLVMKLLVALTALLLVELVQLLGRRRRLGFWRYHR